MIVNRLPRPQELRPLVASLLGVVAGALPVFLTASLAGEIGRSFPLGRAQLGVTVALFHLVGMLISPAVGWVLPWTGPQGTLRLSAFTSATASLAIGLFARSSTQLVLLLMIAGLSNGIAAPTGSALLRSTVAAQRHGLAFGTQQAGAPTSLLLAGLAVPLVGVPLGWRSAFVGAAFIALLAGIVAPRVDGDQWPARPRAATAGATTGSRCARGSRSLLVLLVPAAAAASAVGVAVVSFLVLSASQAGMSQSAAGLLLGGVSLAAVVGRIGFGLQVDRGRTEPLAAAIPLLLACTAGVTFLIPGTQMTIVIGALTIGSLGWTWQGVLALAAVRYNEDAPVWAVGMLMSGVFLGAILGPWLVGTLAGRTSFRTAWSVCAMLSVAPIVLVELARRRCEMPRSAIAGAHGRAAPAD
jgi:predicted MFS family arabinose efflux permease